MGGSLLLLQLQLMFATAPPQVPLKLDDGLAISPPLGFRTRNQFGLEI